MLTVTQLLRPMSRQEAFDELVAQLDSLGFSASSWQSGGKRLGFVMLAAIVWADLSLTIRSVQEAIFILKASGTMLTALCKSHYDLPRLAAVATQGTARLTAAPTAGPYTVVIGTLVAADATGRTFRNITGGTLNLGSTLDLTWESEIAGGDGNIAINTLTVLQTALAGVTINNPGSGIPATWITREGSDEESDANLRTRAISRWAQLSIEKPADGYLGIALSVPGVARAEVDAQNPGGEGTVDVWGAGATGAISGPTLTALQAALSAKRAVSAIVLARASSTQSVAVTATVYVLTAKHDAAYEAACAEAVADYINGLPIGGQKLPSISLGVVDREALFGAIRAIDGTVAVNGTVPAADVSVAAHTIATVGAVSLTFADV